MTLQQYINMYGQSLTEDSMEAIVNLAEVVGRPSPAMAAGVEGWSSFGLGQVHAIIGQQKQKREKLNFLFTFWWHVWKERNWRIFDDK
jgi:hypothetical protein